MSVCVRAVVACLFASASFAGPAVAAAGSPTPAGCYPMLVMSVVDGDTVYGYIDTSDPQVAIRAKLRLEGIDTPEIGSHAQCPEEKAMGAAARDFLRGKLYPSLAQPTRTFARACNIADDKYGGRRVGRLEASSSTRPGSTSASCWSPRAWPSATMAASAAPCGATA